MAAIFVLRIGGWRTALIVGIPILLIAAAALSISPAAQTRVVEISGDMKAGMKTDNASTAARIDFWRKAVEFVAAAPLLGHGTGSIRPLYESLEATRPSPIGAVADPHNQFLHTALQVGLIGGVILLAMWVVHFRMLTGPDLGSAVGLGIVTLTILGSLFNSHISQVTQGMLYCMGVGIFGSVLINSRTTEKPATG